MCKILVIPKINDETRETALKFLKVMHRIMSETNSNGCGYAAMSADGQLFGERWLNNRDAFSDRRPLTELDKKMLAATCGFLSKKEVYDMQGVIREDQMTSIIYHARTATSGKEFYNTHPFFEENTALIHNGVIHNAKQTDMAQSTCDSEVILRKYLDLDVQEDTRNFQKVCNALTGYYACAVMGYDGAGTPIIDVFKSYTASLNAVYIEQLKSLVISTSLYDMQKTCTELNLTILSEYDVVEGHLIRFNAVSGASMLIQKFKERPVDQWSSKKEWDKDSGAWVNEYHKAREKEKSNTVIELPKTPSTPPVTIYNSEKGNAATR